MTQPGFEPTRFLQQPAGGERREYAGQVLGEEWARPDAGAARPPTSLESEEPAEQLLTPEWPGTSPLKVLTSEEAVECLEFLAEMAEQGFPGTDELPEYDSSGRLLGLMRGYPFGFTAEWAAEPRLHGEGRGVPDIYLCEDGLLRAVIVNPEDGLDECGPLPGGPYGPIRPWVGGFEMVEGGAGTLTRFEPHSVEVQLKLLAPDVPA